MHQTGHQLTQQQADDLKAKCQECKAVFESASGGGFAAAAIDEQEIRQAIGDGTFWEKLPQWIIQYGPRIFAFLLEILEGFIPRPTP